jgi:hypothetical protein
MSRRNNVSIINLILSTVFLINEKKEKCTFEKLAKECFDLFPESFSLGEYPLLDSRKLDRPIRSLKSDKIIKVDNNGDLSLTKKGISRAKEIDKIFRQEKLKI